MIKDIFSRSDIEYGNAKTFQLIRGEGRPIPCMLGQMDLEERKKLKPMEGNYNDYQPQP